MLFIRNNLYNNADYIYENIIIVVFKKYYFVLLKSTHA